MPATKRGSKVSKTSTGAGRTSNTAISSRVSVQNVNLPGFTSTVDAAMYNAMKKALLKVLPSRAPGLTQAEMFAAVLPHLPKDLYPGGAKASWWVKCVQLDLEAKRQVVREPSKPLRWHKKVLR